MAFGKVCSLEKFIAVWTPVIRFGHWEPVLVSQLFEAVRFYERSAALRCLWDTRGCNCAARLSQQTDNVLTEVCSSSVQSPMRWRATCIFSVVKYAFWWGKCACVSSMTGELRYDILMDSCLELFHIRELENVKY